jgi:hypothetical protein
MGEGGGVLQRDVVVGGGDDGTGDVSTSSASSMTPTTSQVGARLPPGRVHLSPPPGSPRP